jgi:hypothetical protein
MRSLKQRKHKKNNSLKRYKKKRNNNKMVGGAPNKVIVDGIKEIIADINKKTKNDNLYTNLTNISKYMTRFDKIIDDNTGDKAKKGLFGRTLEEPKIKDYEVILYDFITELKKKFIDDKNIYLSILQIKMEVLKNMISDNAKRTDYGLLKDVIRWAKNLGLGIGENPDFKLKFGFNQKNDKGIYITSYIDIWGKKILSEDFISQMLSTFGLSESFYKMVIGVKLDIEKFNNFKDMKPEDKLKKIENENNERLSALRIDLTKKNTSQEEIDKQIKNLEEEIKKGKTNQLKKIEEEIKKEAETSIANYIYESEKILFDKANSRTNTAVLQDEIEKLKQEQEADKLKALEYEKKVEDIKKEKNDVTYVFGNAEKEHKEQIANLIQQQESEKIKLKNITEESLRIEDKNREILSELEEEKNKLKSSEKSDQDCQRISDFMKKYIAKTRIQNEEREENKNKLIEEIDLLQKNNTEIQELFDGINQTNNQEIYELKKENETIKKENETIKKENETIKKENETIKKENETKGQISINDQNFIKHMCTKEKEQLKERLTQEKQGLEELLTQEKQRVEILKTEEEKKTKEIESIKQNIGQLWDDIKKKCVKENSTCELSEWNNEGFNEKTIIELNEKINNLFQSNETKFQKLETESEGKLTAAATYITELNTKKDTLTKGHTTEISKKNEETKELNNQITELIQERDSLKTDLLSALLKDPNKIEVSLDKKRFYEDICKNIKNIIINAYFLDMLFDKQLESNPKLKGGGYTDGDELEVEKERSNMSPAEAERHKNIKEMKKTIRDSRDNLNNFLQELVKKLNINNPEIMAGLENIDGFAKIAIETNMATYLTASIFFMVGGYKEVNDKEINDKGKKRGKTLKSLGLRNKKQTKSLRSNMMKGGLGPENPKELDNLITKVITDICQQMTLTKDLLRYVPDASIDTKLFEEGLLVFTTVYKQKNRSDNIEPITNFLVPYKEPEIKNMEIKGLLEEIQKYLDKNNKSRFQDNNIRIEEIDGGKK